jgi:hypothetical protein
MLKPVKYLHHQGHGRNSWNHWDDDFHSYLEKWKVKT